MFKSRKLSAAHHFLYFIISFILLVRLLVYTFRTPIYTLHPSSFSVSSLKFKFTTFFVISLFPFLYTWPNHVNYIFLILSWTELIRICWLLTSLHIQLCLHKWNKYISFLPKKTTYCKFIVSSKGPYTEYNTTKVQNCRFDYFFNHHYLKFFLYFLLFLKIETQY